MPAATCPPPATAAAARAYRPRRPAATLLHELVRTNVETWLSTAVGRDEYGRGVPLHVEVDFRRAAAHCWALLLVRIYECLPLKCSRCAEPMRIIAFVLDGPTIERILDHIGEPTQPSAVLPARSPPQGEFGFDQPPATTDWPEMDQTAGQGGGEEWVVEFSVRDGSGATAAFAHAAGPGLSLGVVLMAPAQPPQVRGLRRGAAIASCRNSNSTTCSQVS